MIKPKIELSMICYINIHDNHIHHMQCNIHSISYEIQIMNVKIDKGIFIYTSPKSYIHIQNWSNETFPYKMEPSCQHT